MIKGKNLHVMPTESGWCVIDEANQKIARHFERREDAIAHAREQASLNESDVLIHSTCTGVMSLSTVNLPQRDLLPDAATGEEHISKLAVIERDSDFDPMLGYDEYYFEL
jgi:hypothetical protein